MDSQTMINEEVEKTLHALDDLPQLEGDPFLAARLGARLAEERPRWGDRLTGIPRLKPVVIAVVVILDILTIVHVLRAPVPFSSREQVVSVMREEYHPDHTAY